MTTANTSKKTKKIHRVSDFRDLRKKLGLNQSEFWSRIGVTQSGGSRYECGRPAPKPVSVLAHLVYVDGMNIDARNF